MATLKLELLARVLMASGIPVMETVKKAPKVAAHVRITQTLRMHLVGNDKYQLHEMLEAGPALFSVQEELHLVIDELRHHIEEFAPAFTRVRLEGNRFQPDFLQMDHAEIAAWRLDEIGYDWISDEPKITLEEFREQMEDYWQEACAAEYGEGRDDE